MPKYKTYTINTASEYVSFLRENCLSDDVLFRGQPVDKPLLPKLAHLRLKRPIPETEQQMMAEFKRRAGPFLTTQAKSSWDWLAIAQHHGMPTRLLDWTLNPLAALWFAVRRPATREKRKVYPGVVWVLDPKPSDYVRASAHESPFRVGRTRIFRPNHITSRLVTQAGWFTVHKFMKNQGRFIPLERNKAYNSKLTKLQIPVQRFSEMRFELNRFNVNTASLFPDLDGLCAHIQWLNSYLEDETANIEGHLT